MREYEVVLNELMIDGSKLTGVDGSLIVKVPNYIERLKLLDEQGISGKQEDGLKSAIKIVELAGKYVIKTDAVIDGEEIKSFEDLGIFEQGVKIINHVFSILANGIPAKKI